MRLYQDIYEPIRKLYLSRVPQGVREHIHIKPRDTLLKHRRKRAEAGFFKLYAAGGALTLR